MSYHAAVRLTSATDGLTKLLPAGQAEVMRECWARGPLNVRAVYTTIAARRAVAYTAIMTTCARLAEKGLLRREKAGPGYVYTPTISERAYVRREIAGILDGLARLSVRPQPRTGHTPRAHRQLSQRCGPRPH